MLFSSCRLNYFARISMISGSMFCQNYARIVPNREYIKIRKIISYLERSGKSVLFQLKWFFYFCGQIVIFL